MVKRIFAGLLLAACGGEDDTCEPSDRHGQYDFVFEEVSGDCGPIEMGMSDFSIALGVATEAVPEGCSLIAPDLWSSDQCTLSRHYTCDAFFFIVEDDAITTQLEGDGSVITGTMDRTLVRLPGGSDESTCRSVYSIVATR